MPALDPSPVLQVALPDASPTAVALVLHGGRSRSTDPTRPAQLAVLRLIPFARALHAAGRGHGLVVARLRYRVRGWNGADRSPVTDVRWALGELARRFGQLPAGLVGHSMGGRAGIYSGGDEGVRSLVGVAPWVEPGDPFDQVAGRHVLIAHGDRDRMTSPVESAAWTSRAGDVATSATYVAVAGDAHAMLRRPRLWHDLASGFTLATLCGVDPKRTVDADAANIVEKALAGAASLVV